MGAFFADLWLLIKNAPTIIASYFKLKAIWDKYWLDTNQAKQDKIIQDLKDAAAKAIADKSQIDIQTKISGQDGGLPATNREGVEERPSSVREERQKKELEDAQQP